MDYYGYTAFVLLVTDEQLAKVKQLAEQYRDILDISAKEYGRSGYWYLELEVMDGNRSSKELAGFVFRTFPFVAIRQKDSTFIIASGKEELKKALSTLYTKETKAEFIYNMLTIDERYDALEEASDHSFLFQDDIRIERWIGGCMYSLLYTRGQPCIFTDDPEIDLIFETYNEKETVNLLEGMDIFTFHVAVLREKS